MCHISPVFHILIPNRSLTDGVFGAASVSARIIERIGEFQMNIDKKTLDMLASMPDDKLWQMLSVVASASGLKLPQNKPDEKSMAGLRNAVSELSDSDIKRASEIFARYKEGKQNG